MQVGIVEEFYVIGYACLGIISRFTNLTLRVFRYFSWEESLHRSPLSPNKNWLKRG